MLGPEWEVHIEIKNVNNPINKQTVQMGVFGLSDLKDVLKYLRNAKRKIIKMIKQEEQG